jgi:putative membrane protein insertion efficiency factor
MPSLRIRRVKRKAWLAGLALGILLLVGADAMRPPQSQCGVRCFVAAVDGYHRYLHPITSRYIRCRYRPTCSAYAVAAALKYGMVKGGWMGLRRLISCQPRVPMGTLDPVP